MSQRRNTFRPRNVRLPASATVGPVPPGPPPAGTVPAGPPPAGPPTADPGTLAAYDELKRSQSGLPDPDFAKNPLAPDSPATWPTFDVTGPTVEDPSRLPQPDLTGVTVTAAVKARFSELMDRASLTTEDPANPNAPKNSVVFTLTKKDDFTAVPAAVAYTEIDTDGDGMVDRGEVTLTPTNRLDSKTWYTATIRGGTGGATDLSGNPLTETESWSFETA
jgi:hypothetical protein